MACHEIAALRLGMMKVLGVNDEAAKLHDINEIGKDILAKAGPIKSLSEAGNLLALRKFYENSLTDLEQKIAATPPNDTKLPYYRSLLILTKKVELELRNASEYLEKIYRDLDEMHDYVHEIYPG